MIKLLNGWMVGWLNKAKAKAKAEKERRWLDD